MSLPALYKFPEDQGDWAGWSFNHAANHYDWLLSPMLTGKKLDQFMLDPMNPDDIGMWLYHHQTMHDQINAALGTKGLDLLLLDWEDSDQLRNWLNTNAAEHIRISAALGVQ